MHLLHPRLKLPGAVCSRIQSTQFHHRGCFSRVRANIREKNKRQKNKHMSDEVGKNLRNKKEAIFEYVLGVFQSQNFLVHTSRFHPTTE